MDMQQDAYLISEQIETNIQNLFQYFHSSDDVRSRAFTMQGLKGSLIYLSTITDIDKLQSDILKPLQQSGEGRLEDILPILNIELATDLKTAATRMLQGKCAILLEQRMDIVLVDASARVAHSVGEPQNEQTIRGSHVGFVDDVYP